MKSFSRARGYNLFENKEFLRVLPRFIFDYFPRFFSIEEKYFKYNLHNRNWFDLFKTFFNFIIMLGIDFLWEKWEPPTQDQQELQTQARALGRAYLCSQDWSCQQIPNLLIDTTETYKEDVDIQNLEGDVLFAL